MSYFMPAAAAARSAAREAEGHAGRHEDAGDAALLLLTARQKARKAAARLPAGHPAIPKVVEAVLALDAAMALALAESQT